MSEGFRALLEQARLRGLEKQRQQAAIAQNILQPIREVGGSIVKARQEQRQGEMLSQILGAPTSTAATSDIARPGETVASVPEMQTLAISNSVSQKIADNEQRIGALMASPQLTNHPQYKVAMDKLQKENKELKQMQRTEIASAKKQELEKFKNLQKAKMEFRSAGGTADELAALGDDILEISGRAGELKRAATKKDVDFDAAEAASAIMDPLSSMKLTDISLKHRAKVDLEMQKIRNKIMDEAGTDHERLVATMRASAGKKALTFEAERNLGKGALVLDQINELNTIFMDDKSLSKKFGISLEPIEGIIRGINPWDVKAKEITSQIQRIIPNLARGIFGEVGVLTDNDIRLYANTLPNLKSIEDVRKAMLALTIKAAKNSIMRTIEISAANRDVSGLVNVVNTFENMSNRMLRGIPGFDKRQGQGTGAVMSREEKIRQIRKLKSQEGVS